MRINRITHHHRNDLYGMMVCEHCQHEQKFVGYDDANWHQNVAPQIACKACGKTANDERPSKRLGTYREQMIDAGRGHLLSGKEG